MKKLLLILPFLAAAVSCVNPLPSGPFLETREVQLSIGGRKIIEYDELTCQKSYFPGRKEFCALNDDGNRYFSVIVDRIPSSEKQTVTARLEWTMNNGTVRVWDNVTLEVLKVEGDKIWMWNAKQNVEACIQIIR